MKESLVKDVTDGSGLVGWLAQERGEMFMRRMHAEGPERKRGDTGQTPVWIINPLYFLQVFI